MDGAPGRWKQPVALRNAHSNENRQGVPCSHFHVTFCSRFPLRSFPRRVFRKYAPDGDGVKLSPLLLTRIIISHGALLSDRQVPWLTNCHDDYAPDPRFLTQRMPYIQSCLPARPPSNEQCSTLWHMAAAQPTTVHHRTPVSAGCPDYHPDVHPTTSSDEPATPSGVVLRQSTTNRSAE
jgi:hypothetical protein